MKILSWNKAVGLGIIILYVLFVSSIAMSIYTTYFTDEDQFIRITLRTALVPLIFGIIGILIGNLVFNRKMRIDFGIALSLLNFSIFIFLIYII